jgi:hypothetical protein
MQIGNGMSLGDKCYEEGKEMVFRRASDVHCM